MRSRAKAAITIIWREYQLSRRTASFWAVAGLGSVLAVWRGSSPGTPAALAAHQTWQIIVFGLGMMAILLAGSAAVRDRRRGAEEFVLVKPEGTTAALVVARFIASALSLLTIAAVMLGVTAVAQVVLAGTEPRLGPYAAAFQRSLCPLGLAVALGFSLTSLFGTQLAAALAAVYWVAVPLARPHTPMVLDLTLSQHWPQCALLACALVALSASLHARTLRSDRRPGRWTAGVAFLLFASTTLAVLGACWSGDDALLEPNPVLAAMASQAVSKGGPAAGFWLPDADGNLVGLSDFDGRPVVLSFWGPGAPESVRALPLLDALAVRHSGAGLSAIGICLDRDAAAMEPFAAEVRGNVVLLWDRGRHFGDGLEWSDSPVAVAYDVRSVPTIVVLDRHRRVIDILAHQDALARLDSVVSRLLQER
jgi:peroxiredoxin